MKKIIVLIALLSFESMADDLSQACEKLLNWDQLKMPQRVAQCTSLESSSGETKVVSLDLCMARAFNYVVPTYVFLGRLKSQSGTTGEIKIEDLYLERLYGDALYAKYWFFGEKQYKHQGLEWKTSTHLVFNRFAESMSLERTVYTRANETDEFTLKLNADITAHCTFY